MEICTKLCVRDCSYLLYMEPFHLLKLICPSTKERPTQTEHMCLLIPRCHSLFLKNYSKISMNTSNDFFFCILHKDEFTPHESSPIPSPATDATTNQLARLPKQYNNGKKQTLPHCPWDVQFSFCYLHNVYWACFSFIYTSKSSGYNKRTEVMERKEN